MPLSIKRAAMDRLNHTTRSRAARRWIASVLLAWLAVTSTGGCQIIIGLILMARGRDKLPSDFTTKTRVKLWSKGVRTLVLCSSTDSAKSALASLDQDLSTEIARRMRSRDIDVIDPHDVVRWMEDRGGSVSDATYAEIGKKFKVDYIVLVTVEDFGYRPPASTGLYQGRAKGMIKVLAVSAAAAEKTKSKRKGTIYVDPFDSKYPLNEPIPQDYSDASIFQKQYIERLGEELSRRFYDHFPGDDIAY
jgi:hypothetical protein